MDERKSKRGQVLPTRDSMPRRSEPWKKDFSFLWTRASLRGCEREATQREKQGRVMERSRPQSVAVSEAGSMPGYFNSMDQYIFFLPDAKLS